MQVYCLQGPGHVSWPQSAGWHSITPARPGCVAHPTGTWTQLTITPRVTQFYAPVELKYIILWQGKSERSDWFFLGRDFAIRTVSVETVISCVFFAFESRQIQNKHGLSDI